MEGGVAVGERLAGAWETIGQPFTGWVGERWEFDADGRGRVISAGVLLTAGIVEFTWEGVSETEIRLRFEGDRWRTVTVALTETESGEQLTEPGGDGFCGSDGPLRRAGAWAET